MNTLSKRGLFAIAAFFCLNCFKVSAQTINLRGKNIIHYKADILNLLTIENYENKVIEREVQRKVYGVDVNIYVDTVFKKYTLIWKDENNSPLSMSYSYVRDYFVGNNKEKMYLMNTQKKNFFLIDFLDHPLLRMLEIRFEDLIDGRVTTLFKIENATYVPR